jgi:hypothetical protein
MELTQNKPRNKEMASLNLIAIICMQHITAMTSSCISNKATLLDSTVLNKQGIKLARLTNYKIFLGTQNNGITNS